MAKQKESAGAVEELDLIEKINELESRVTLLTDIIGTLETDLKKIKEFKQPTGVAGLDLQVQFEKCLEISMMNHIRASPNLVRKAADNINYVRRDAKGIIEFATALHEEICKSFASKQPEK